AALPFSAEAANAPPQLKSRPAASATGPNPRTTRIDPASLARLRPHIDQRGLAGFHHRDGFLDRRSELRRILDRPLRPPAHRLRELVIFDVGIFDAGPDWPHVSTMVSDAIAEVGQALDVHDLLMIAAVVEHHGQLR